MVNGASPCPDDHPEEVIYRKSPEISSVCTCRQYEYRYSEGRRYKADIGRQFMFDRVCEWYERKELFSGCDYFDAVPSMNLSNIGGRKICGLRGGRNFKDTVRPIN